MFLKICYRKMVYFLGNLQNGVIYRHEFHLRTMREQRMFNAKIEATCATGKYPVKVTITVTFSKGVTNKSINRTVNARIVATIGFLAEIVSRCRWIPFSIAFTLKGN